MTVNEEPHLRTLDHVMDSLLCWCRPVAVRVCPECRGGTDCPRCKGGGLVLAAYGEMDLIMHHEME